MSNQRNKESFTARERRMLPFFITFVKFSVGFAIIISLALVTLHAAAASMQ